MPGVSSGNVDERIVEMRIDHEKFEAGAKKTIDILEKLDNGLKSLGKENADGFDSVAHSLDKVTDRFSAMGIVGDQIIRNLTNKAMELVGQMGKLATSLSLDQISVGWGKYAEKTQGVQTIMAATAKDWEDQGAQIEWVNSQLEKLNLFTDETSYNFLDMVNNIGKFTSNGVKLETAVTAMEGISNWAAISGGTINEAGRAMYNMSQALATGSVKLIDWKSIENANMATREFKETALETAVALGTLQKNGNTFVTKAGHAFTTEQFNTQLSDGWFTSDVLLQTLTIYGEFTDVLLETSEITGETVTDLLDMVDTYKETGKASAELLPYIKELAKDEYDLGRRAFKAAQEAKTFQEALDATKDAVSTGWMNLFETMFGNYLTAKEFWTGIANSLYDIFAEPINKLNDIFDLAFKGPNPLKDSLAEAAFSMHDMEEAAKNVADDMVIAFGGTVQSYGISSIIEQYGSLEAAIKAGAISAEQFQKILDQMNADRLYDILNGKNDTFNQKIEDIKQNAQWLMNGAISRETLKARGYDLKMIDWWVNKWKNAVKENGSDITLENQAPYLTQFMDQFQDDLLHLAGYTDDEIAKFKELGMTAEDVLASMTDPKVTRAEGFKLFTESLQNLLNVFAKVSETARKAFDLIFGGGDEDTANENAAEGIYSLIERFHAFTVSLEITDEKAEALKQKFVRLFTVFSNFTGVIDFLKAILSGIFSIAVKLFNTLRQSGIFQAVISSLLILLQALLIPVQLIVAGIVALIDKGKELGKQEWAKALSSWFATIAEKITAAANSFKEFMSSAKVSNWITNALSKVAGFLNTIGNAVQKVFGNVSKYLKLFKREFSVNGLLGVLSLAGRLISDRFSSIFDDLKKRFDAGGIKEVFKGIIESIAAFFNKSVDFKSITESISTFLTNAVTKVGSLLFGKLDASKITEITTAIQNFFSGTFGSVGEFLTNNFNLTAIGTKLSEIGEAISGGLGKFGSAVFGKINFENVGQFISDFLKMLTNISKDAMPVIKTATIAYILISIAKWSRALRWAVESVSEVAEGLKIGALSSLIGSLAALIFSISASIFILSLIPPRKMQTAIEALLGVGLIISLVVGLITAIDSTWGGINVKALWAIVPAAIAIAVIAGSLAFLSLVNPKKLFVAWFALSTILLDIIGFTIFAGNVKNKGLGDVLKIALGIWLIAKALKGLGEMNTKELLKGWLGLKLIINQIIHFTWFSRKLGWDSNFDKLLYVAASAWILAKAMKGLGSMDFTEILKGWIGLSLIMGQIIRFTKKSSSFNYGKELFGLIGVALTLTILVGAFKRLGNMNFASIMKAAIAMFLLVGSLIRVMQASFSKGVGNSLFSERQSINGKQLWGLIAIAITVAALAEVMARIGLLPTKQIIKGFAGLGAIMFALSKFMGSMKGSFQTGATKKILASLVIIGIIVSASAALHKLSRLPAKQLASAAGALSVILLALGGSMALISKFGGAFNWHSLGALAAGLGALWLVGEILVPFGESNLDWDKIGKAALICIGTIVGIAGAAVLLGKIPTGGAVKGVIGIGAILAAIEIVVLALTAIGLALVSVATTMASKLSEFTKALAPFLEDIKSYDDSTVESLDRFASMMGKLALAEVFTAVSSVLGKVPSAALFDDLKQLGTAVQEFVTDISGFTDDDTAKITRFGSIMESIAGITGWEALGSVFAAISDWINKSDSVGEETDNASRLFDNLASLARGFGKFSEELANINFAEGVEKKVETFAKIMMSLTEVELWNVVATMMNALGNIASSVGSKFGPTFMENISNLASGVADFAKAISAKDFPKDPKKKIEQFVEIMQLLTKVTAWDAVGKMMAAVGNKWGESYSSQLVALPGTIRDFVNAIKKAEIGSGSEERIAAFASIMNSIGLITAWDALSKMFTALGNIVKASWGNQLIQLPATVGGFVAVINKYPVTEGDADRIKAFAGVMQEITAITGWTTLADIIDAIGPDTSGGGAMTSLASFTEKLPDFISNISKLDGTEPAKIETFKTLVGQIVQAQLWGTTGSAITTDDAKKLSDLGATVVIFADQVLPFVNKFSDTTVENVQKMVDTFNVLKDIREFHLVSGLMDEVQTFFIGLTSTGIDMEATAGILASMAEYVNSIVNLRELMMNASGGMEGGIDLSGFGSDIMTSIASGVSGSRDTVKTAIVVAVNAAVILATTDSGLVATAGTMGEPIGENIGAGVARGIAASTAVCVAAAVSLATAINNAFAGALEIRSPSRVFARLGAFIPAGVAKGIEENTGVAEESIIIMSSAVLAAMQQAMLSVATIADDNFEYNPMITPVVDMSNVTAAAGSAGGLFGNVGMALRASSRVSMDTAQNTAAAVTYGGGAESIVSELQRMGSRLDNLGDAITNMKIVLDSGELVGATSRQMDDAFGVLQMHKGRGN